MPITPSHIKPTITNSTLTAVASTDVTQINLPAGTARFTFQSRAAKNLFYAYTFLGAMTSNASFMTLKAGSVYNSEQHFMASTSDIYARGSTAGQVVETEAWATT